MPFFIKIGNDIFNLDQIVSVTSNDDRVYVTLSSISETGNLPASEVYQYSGKKAEAIFAWFSNADRVVDLLPELIDKYDRADRVV